MNNIPVWWDTKITLYNKQTDPITKVVKWYRTELSNCFWKRVNSVIETSNAITDIHSIINAYSVICRIPENNKFQEYLGEPIDLDRHFTLNPGDIIVKGSCEEEINEYEKGQRSTDFLTKHKSHALEIKEFSINTMTGVTTPHYRILGK